MINMTNMNTQNSFRKKIILDGKKLNAVILIIIILLIGNQILIQLENKKSQEVSKTQDQEFSKKIQDIETILLFTQTENTTLAEALEQARENSEDLESQFRRVNNNVQDLEKIATTDSELLQKYSKVYFLNEHYSPSDLEKIDSKFTYNKDRTYQVHEEIIDELEELLEDAESDGMSLLVISAFRSFSEQAQLKGAYTVTYGAGTANQFSADQGYSEHQLGTTVDFTTPTVGATFSGFANTAEYKWLQDNAHKYGFTLSYPKDNQFYQFEPWHWRFVGKKLARDLYNNNQFFYDLSQREINNYIIDLFD